TYVTVVAQSPVDLRLNGLAGDDTFNIYAPQPYGVILINGGEPSGSDVLNVIGAAGADAFNVKFFSALSPGGLPSVDGFPVPMQISDTGPNTQIGITG